VDDREIGRGHFARRAWAAAHEALSRADRSHPLEPDDLERLALSAYLIGRDDDYLSLLQRAYHAYLAKRAQASAARAAFWLGLRLMFRGDAGQATGWLGRAQRLVETEAAETVERGYLLLAVTQMQMDSGDLEHAAETAQTAARSGERFADADLTATARHLIGRIRLQEGRIPEGLGLLDEAMLAATGGELSPLVTGLVYCSVIDGCQEVFALERAREWTRALSDWCEQQPEMLAFAGICSVHRAELLQLRGAWAESLLEAERAVARCAQVNRRATGAAYYQQGDLRRLRGELEAAEESYQLADQLGMDPQPGLALLRLAQARTEAAAGSIGLALAAAKERSRRARLLPAYIEIMLALGKLEEAEAACREVDEIASHFGSGLLRAHSAQARGMLQLARGESLEASRLLREAFQQWQAIDAPYLAARVRLLLARCARALHDADGERFELRAARAAFAELGLAEYPGANDLIGAKSGAGHRHPLTARELEVLRLVATGATNKAIALSLSLSEKTVERHISNIFTKLGVPSRAAATAYAYEHRLL